MSAEIIKLLGRRGLTNIPGDQRELLERHGIGTIRPLGAEPSEEDVPRRVLSAVKEAYLESRKRKAPSSKLASSGRPSKSRQFDNSRSTSGEESIEDDEPSDNGVQGSSADSRPLPEADGQVSGAEMEECNKQTVDELNGDENRRGSPALEQLSPATDESPERFVSWPGSPVEPQAEPHAEQDADPVTLAHPNPPPDVDVSPPSKRSESLPAGTKSQHLAAVIHFPSSLEETVEADELSGHAQDQNTEQTTSKSEMGSPVKTPNMLEPPAMETPPCAQPSQTVIPGTVAPKTREGADDGQHRSRRMKPIEFSDSQDATLSLGLANASTTFHRMAPTRAYHEISTSSLVTSSSIIPASPRNSTTLHNPQDTNKQPSSQPEVGMQKEELDDVEMVTTDEGQHQDEHAPQDPHQHRPEAPTNAPLPGDKANVPEDKTKTPFETFLAVYPSYIIQHAGSLALFLRACICLEHMAKYRRMHHYLWDDFIRSFSAEYLDYVHNTANPLVASEWYHARDEPPQFREGVVNKHNLDDIMSSYPGEIARARRYTVEGDGSPAKRRSTVQHQGTSSTRPISAGGKTKPPPAERSGTVTPTNNASLSPAPAPERQKKPLVPQSSAQSWAPVKTPTAQKPQRHSMGSVPASGASSSVPGGLETPPARRPASRSSAGAWNPSTGKGYLKSLSRRRTLTEQEKVRKFIQR